MCRVLRLYKSKPNADEWLRAYYTPGEKAAEGEDFTVTYSYDELSRPTDVDRSGVVSVDADGVETFGMLDELTYCYGSLLSQGV